MAGAITAIGSPSILVWFNGKITCKWLRDSKCIACQILVLWMVMACLAWDGYAMADFYCSCTIVSALATDS